MNNVNLARSFTTEQIYFSNVFENLRFMRLPDGRSFSEALTLEGIPFFDVFEAEMAWRHLTTTKAAKSIGTKLKLRAKPTLLRLKQIYADRFSMPLVNIEWPDGPVMICLAFTGRMYQDVLEPVVRKVLDGDELRVVLTSQAPMAEAQYQSGLGLTNVATDTYWNAEIDSIYRLLKVAFGKLPKKHEIWKSMERCSNYDSMVRSERLSASQVYEALNLLLKYYIPLILRQAAIAKFILTKKRPSLVLSADISDARARLYSVLCKQYSIPSINVQFGLTGDEAVEWRNYSGSGVAVWGESSRQALLRNGVPSDKILVTGSPRHELLNAASSSVRSSVRAKLKINQGRPVVLLASTYFDPTHSAYVDRNSLSTMKRTIFALANKYPEIFLIVKPHPVEDVSDTKSFAGVADNVLVVDRDIDGREFIPACDVFISFGSTMTIDALLSEKLCICPAYPGWPFSELFAGTGAVLSPRSPDEMDQIFSKIATNDWTFLNMEMINARAIFLNSIVHTAGEGAAERIRRMIKEAIDGTSPNSSG
jgi:hypothetical protein